MALAPPRLLIVADRDYAGSNDAWQAALAHAATALRGHPGAVQVRAKSASGQALRELAIRARDVVPANVPLLLNGPAELARDVGYTGVHWPQVDIPPAPPVADGLDMHSAAVHDAPSLERAQRAGANFVVFGPVFAPGSKTATPAGLESLRAITAVASVPVIAIGGITPGTVADCLAAGAHGVAVVSGIIGANDPAAAVADYLDAFRTATGGQP